MERADAVVGESAHLFEDRLGLFPKGAGGSFDSGAVAVGGSGFATRKLRDEFVDADAVQQGVGPKNQQCPTVGR